MKKRVLLTYSPAIVDKPITYDLIKKYDIVINILQAKIFPEEEGQLIIELEHKEEARLLEGIEYLEDVGVKVKILEKSIIFDRELCIDCGVCTGICKSGALTMDPKNWELEVNDSKCVLCEMCIIVCPVKALSLEG